MRHPHADLIIAWAEGAEIEMFDGENWNRVYTPTFKPELQYRIKPKGPEWFEQIPEHGVLCWVSDIYSNPDANNAALRVITKHFFDEWRYATPLTDDEIKQFLRGEQ